MKSNSVKRRGRKGRKNRKPSRAFRKRTIEVVNLSSDNASDVEFLEEVIVLSSSDDEREVLKHTVKERDGKSASDAGAESGETNYPGSNSSSANAGNPSCSPSLDPVSPYSFGSPHSSLRSISPYEDAESTEADLPASDVSHDGSAEIGDSEEMIIEITPLSTTESDQTETFQGESGMSLKTDCEDDGPIQGNQEVPVVSEDRKTPSMQSDQEVPFGQMDQDGVNNDVGQGDEAVGQGDEVIGQGSEVTGRGSEVVEEGDAFPDD